VERLGNQLRIVRERLALSQRDVARKSVEFAKDRGSELYQLTHGWLARVERDQHPEHNFGAHQLIALLSIYGLTLEELLTVNSSAELPDDMSDIPENTLETVVLNGSAADTAARILLPDDSTFGAIQENTIVARAATPKSTGRFLRIVIGQQNNYLYPIVPAGTVALIDRYRRSLRQEPLNVEIEIQRPMFLLQYRDGKNICCWCELVDEDERRAVILPHATNRWRAFEVIIDRDVSVIGQVVVVRIPTAPRKQ